MSVRIVMVLACLLLGGCVTKAGLEEILQKIDHNNMIMINRIEKLEGEKTDGTEAKNVPTPQAK